MANFCATCGVALTPEGQCPKCGRVYVDSEPATQSTQPNYTVGNTQTKQKSNDGFFEKITMPLTEMAGENDFIDLKIRDLFSKVFKRHTLDEAESIFVAGTRRTTPKISTLSDTWPKPWLFSRVFLMFLITFALLYICFGFFGNGNALPGLIFIGAVAVPVSCLVFFMEVNAPRNISFYEVLKVFFIGGGASLVAALILFSFISPGESLDYVGATIVGVVEEIAKFVIVAYFIKRNKEANFVLNGILIGAAVGAGFAAFETAGYILTYGLNYGGEAMMAVLWLRALLAPGGHVAWAAISGGALLLVKRDKPFNMSQIFDKKFLGFFAISIATHAIWDMPISVGIDFPVVQIALTIFVLAVLLVLISAGLKEVARKASSARAKEYAEAQQTAETVTL